ncbi:MAG: VWA domain-containing protein, partial [Thermoanaerobaculia bacterium]
MLLLPAPRDFRATALMLAAVSLVGVSSGSIHGQTVAEVFKDAIEVVEIQVPVNVVGKDGEPIRDLTAADFEILDGKKTQEITGFRVVDLDLIRSEMTRREMELAVPAAARRHFLLLFDLSFSTPTSILKARQAARQFVLESLHPTDLAAVMVFEAEWGPRLVITFTPDRVQLARAIDTMGGARWMMAGRNNLDPLRFMVPDLTPGRSPGISDPLPARPGEPGSANDALAAATFRAVGKLMSDTEKSYEAGRVASWATSMQSLGRLLDSVQGRKHVIHFSEGFDGRHFLGRTPDPNDPAFQEDRSNIEWGQLWMVDSNDLYGNTSLQGAMAQMVEEFRRADAVIQAVDISGLGVDSEAAQRVKDTTQSALFYIANETGGELFNNANNFGPELEQVLQHTSVTYVLTFQPDEIDFDGSFHKLKVKADLPRGSRVFYRQGYFAPRPFSDLDPLEKQLLASDAIAAAEPRKDVGVQILATPFKASDEAAYVPIIIEVDGGSLIRGQDGDDVAAEIYTYVSDSQGQMLDFFTQLVSLDVSRGKESFVRGGVKYYGQLFLPPGDYMVRVLVRNSLTGRTGVETVGVAVPSYEVQPAVLLPPLFLESQERWVLVRENREGPDQGTVIYPFTVRGEPFIPAAKPSVRQRGHIDVCLVAYNLGDSNLELDAMVFDSDQQLIEGGAFD